MNLQTVLDSLRRLLESPTSNLVATSLAFAIVVIVVLILIMIALIALVPREETHAPIDDEPEEQDDTYADDGEPAHDESDVPAVAKSHKPPSTSVRRLRSIALASLALIAVVGMLAMSGSNQYCSSSCHTMVDAGDTWATSPHAKTPCVRCHENSIADAVSARARHVVAEAGGAQGFTRRAAVSSSQCLGCHDSIRKGTITSDRGILVEHAHIIAAGTDCTRCHPTAGHAKTAVITRRGTMSDCLRCHDGVQALAGCFICHEGDVAKAALTDRTFGKTRLPEPRCGGCHQEDTCDACHGLRMPHPDNYADPRQHARAGAFDGREKLCYRCHTNQDCGRCHISLDSGHALGWKQDHKERPRAEGNGYCLACHKPKDFCAVCHN